MSGSSNPKSWSAGLASGTGTSVIPNRKFARSLSENISEPAARIVESIDESRLVTLKGNTQLRTAVEQRAIPKPYEARLSCHPHERAWIEKLLREHSPGMTFSEPRLMSHVIETPEVKFQLGERYFRGIAKIGLHYFLTQFPIYSGYEKIFSRIRALIYQETKNPVRRVNEFVHARHAPLLLPMLNPDARSDGRRAHVLGAETRPGSCLAHIQVLLTGENPGPIYTINLVEDPAITEYAAHAYLYRYFSDGK